MASAFVKLRGAQNRYLNLDGQSGLEIHPTPSGWGVELRKPLSVTIVGGEKDGLELDGTTVRAGQKVALAFGDVKAGAYHILVQPNHELGALASLMTPTIVEPGDVAELTVYLKADRQVDLTSIGWFLRLFVID